MILVDTSVWIDHLRKGEPGLVHLLEEGQVATHPMVIGELACGRLRSRDEVLSLLADLPQAKRADDREVLLLIEAQALAGRGLGWIDMHLLASCRLSGLGLWTKDKRLHGAAAQMDLSAHD